MGKTTLPKSLMVAIAIRTGRIAPDVQLHNNLNPVPGKGGFAILRL